MRVGDVISVSGCVTKDKFIAGRTLSEIERILGFFAGRFSQGIAVAALSELPGLGQFELAAYSNVAMHRHTAPDGLDIAKIKVNAKATWATAGFERLVKVLPTIRHDPNLDPDIQYPPGLGVPQWIVKVPLTARIVAIVLDYPKGRYFAADAARR